jgi:hypothetical protein
VPNVHGTFVNVKELGTVLILFTKLNYSMMLMIMEMVKSI